MPNNYTIINDRTNQTEIKSVDKVSGDELRCITLNKSLNFEAYSQRELNLKT